MNKKRLHRRDPERSRPFRGWDTLYGGDTLRGPDLEQSEPDSEFAPNSESADKGPWDDVTNRAIERGYEVIEEQIKQGARLAEQFSKGRIFDASATTNELSRLLERSMDFYSDFGSLWFELVESLISNASKPHRDEGRESDAPPFANGNHNGNGHANGHLNTENVAIEVDSPYPTVVQLNLSGSVGSSLAAQALRSLDDLKPPIRDIYFETGVGPPTIRIRIPDGQPTDTYSGVIFDTRTNSPGGTLSVRVRNDSESDRE